MRKFIMLSAMILLCIMHAKAQQAVSFGGVKYYLEGDEATVMIQSEDLSGDIAIPSTLSYDGEEYTVRNVTSSAFKGTKITSIVLPNTITSMGTECFRGCRYLQSATLPDDITELGYRSFYHCYKLASLVLPKRLTSLGGECIYECNSLGSIALPDSLKSIGDNCFMSCSALSAIAIPKGVTSLPTNCFRYCSNLSSVSLPEGLFSLGYYGPTDFFRGTYTAPQPNI